MQVVTVVETSIGSVSATREDLWVLIEHTG